MTDNELIALLQPMLPDRPFGEWTGENATTEAVMEAHWWNDACRKLVEEIERLKTAVADVHKSWHADDLCWRDLDKLFAAAGLPRLITASATKQR